ncbi:MAG: MFS transporter [Acidimicrobiales bacterium]
MPADEGAIEGEAAPGNRWAILSVALYGLFSVNVTVTILAVSIHRIGGELGTTDAAMTWVVTGPMLAFGVIGPLVGKLGDRIGHRRIYLLGLAGAAFMAALSALAWNALSLIAFRTLGGSRARPPAWPPSPSSPASSPAPSGSGPPAGRAMVAAGAPVVGVVAGGPLVEAFGWRALSWPRCPRARRPGAGVPPVPRDAAPPPVASTRGRRPPRWGDLAAVRHRRGPPPGWGHPAVVGALAAGRRRRRLRGPGAPPRRR